MLQKLRCVSSRLLRLDEDGLRGNAVLMMGLIVVGYMLGPSGDLQRAWRSREKYGGRPSGRFF
jgi:hypothetical protein